ncbi:MAG: asparagine synthase (glutamine-hydrolyzing) [Planctomycetota bacterium]|jgi:asparagine synthase (glutamine-hydrolysing)
MCGIAGAIGAIDERVEGAVRAMHAGLRHRGPDDEGWWRDPGDVGCALAHRRLAIIDLSHGAAQPMSDELTGNVIAFNGEIYNYRELRDELLREGVRFATAGDTEVALKAYGRWGEAFLERLRGMFALVIWDAEHRRALLARDRLGIKPLYWAAMRSGAGPTLLVSSELRALLASGAVERRLDPLGVAAYLWNGFVPGPGTMIRDVQLLPAGSRAVVDPASPAIAPQPYWRPPRAAAGTSGPDALGAALREAVGMRLVSDVPLGIFLSGGVDSSAVAALAAAAADAPLRTFNVAFEEAAWDESRYARTVAEALGAEHEELRLTEAMFAERLPDALAALDQPTFDAVNSYVVSRAVREAGLTVALAGTGGDELFGGYRSFTDLPRARPVARALRFLPEGLLRGAARVGTRLKTGRPGAVPPQTRWGKLGDVLATRGDLVALYQCFYGLFTTEFLAAVQGPGLRGLTRWGLPPTRAEELAALVAGDPVLHAVSSLELSCFVGERLLRDTDAASMAVSLEVRVPLLDHVVVEQAAAQDLDRRFRPPGRKQLLRDLALSELDPAWFDRPKSGFVLPLDRWCRRRLRGAVDELLRDEAACRAAGLEPAPVAALWQAFQADAPGLYWSRIWSLYVLLWWCRHYAVTME